MRRVFQKLAGFPSGFAVRWSCSTLVALAGLITVAWSSGTETQQLKPESLDLRDSCILVNREEPPYVHRAISDLGNEIRDSTRETVPIFESWSHASASGKPLVIVVGRGAAESVPGFDKQLLASLDGDGFILRSVLLDGKQNRQGLVAAGADSHGTNYAVLDLVRRISQNFQLSAAGLNVREDPRYELRGTYAHPAWVYNHPFALRSWTLNDWKRYVDILAYLRLNLFQFWPLAEILPSPLSAADEDYLSQFNEVVRYALVERGFREV
jgi:hypothetical protein